MKRRTSAWMKLSSLQGVVLRVSHRLLLGPAEGVDARVIDEAHGAPQLQLQPREVLQRVFVDAHLRAQRL